MSRAFSLEIYAARAVALLREAIQKGYRDLEQLNKEPAFDRVRARADFKKVVQELETK